MPRIGRKKRSDPALYELFKKDISPRAVAVSKQPPPPEPEPEPEPTQEPEPQPEAQQPELQPEPEPELIEEQEATTVTESTSEGFNWLSPGSSMRVPIGYIFLGIAAVLVVIIGTFIFGHLRGGQDKEREFGDFGPLNTNGDSPVIAQDPMGQDSITMGEISDIQGTTPSTDQLNGSDSALKNSSTNSEWGLIESDPRQEGYNYYILIHTTRQNAIKLAKFCRSDQIRAHVIEKPGRSSQYQVIVLPGYRRGESDSAEIIQLKSRLKAVTRNWNLHINSRDDLSYYPERFNG